jgi:ubiquinol-cytochrome c reductase cytochrome b subunit
MYRKNINFLWSFGVLVMLVFAILVVSGIFLLMYYKPDAHLAFDSVNKTIMMDVEYGWLFRHTHAVAASIMFLVLYIIWQEEFTMVLLNHQEK